MRKKTHFSIRHLTWIFTLSLFLFTALIGGFLYASTQDQNTFLWPFVQHNTKLTLIGLFALQIIAAVAVFLTNYKLLIKPLRKLSLQIDMMQHDNPVLDAELAKPLRLEEMENVRRSLHHYQQQLRELHGTLENQNKEFHSQARHDVLTRCFNRRAYEEDWAQLKQSVVSTPRNIAYLIFDCDRFKTINDTYGHATGDRVLMTIADAVVMALRANDRLYRLGGDEFATLLAQTTPEQARQVAQRCQMLIEAASFSELGVAEPVSVSIGIAYCAADNNAQIASLPKQADIAMYSAKQPGHHKIAFYNKQTDAAIDTMYASRESSALYQALANPGMIQMHYQSVNSLASDQVEYYEALARIKWRDELIQPGAFLPVVSGRRLEAEFDLAVLMQIDQDLASGLLPKGRGVSINLSAQSLPRAEIISQLMELSRYGEAHPLILEITETSLITQMIEAQHYLDLLRAAHFRIAMDDFGTGYSPMRYLVELPVDIIKFDISLIKKLEENDRAGRVVADFARMMAEAGYDLVAEGVENEIVLERVRSLGFGHVQGFLLGHPQPLYKMAPEEAMLQTYHQPKTHTALH